MLAICKKQYEAAKYWPVNSILKYTITAQGVQRIRPYVVNRPSDGSYKCEGEDDVIRQIGEEYRSPSGSMPGSGGTAKYMLEKCDNDVIKDKILNNVALDGNCLFHYVKSPSGFVDRILLSSEKLSTIQRSAHKAAHQQLWSLGFSSYCKLDPGDYSFEITDKILSGELQRGEREGDLGKPCWRKAVIAWQLNIEPKDFTGEVYFDSTSTTQESLVHTEKHAGLCSPL